MDAKRYAGATLRNRQPILAVLQQYLTRRGSVLEIASGTGEHAVFFAGEFPNYQWYPSDRDSELRASIIAWSQEYKGSNLHHPLDIDATQEPWIIEKQDLKIDAILNINMIHISPYSACQGLMRGARRILKPGGILYLYGPYKRAGKHTAPSNEAFDRSLRMCNPQWGVRDLETVITEAKNNQLTLKEIVPMPANNLSVIFVRV